MAEVLGVLAVLVPAAIGIGTAALALAGLVAFGAALPRVGANAAVIVAVCVGIGLGLLAGFLAWQFVAGVSCMFSDSSDCDARAQMPALLLGAVAGLLVLLASVAGAGMALRTARIPAAVGSVAGPIVLVIVAILVGGSSAMLQSASSTITNQQASDAQAARSAALSLGTSQVHPTVTTDGSLVLAVHLTAEVRTTRAITVSIDSKITYPRFRLIAPQSGGVEGTYIASATFGFTPGTASRYSLAFDFRGLSQRPAPGRQVASTGGGPAAPGTWLLEMEIVDDGGLRYIVTTPVTIVAGA
jgi:hypothetical protein